MRIQLVSQASVIIDTADTVVWCDPWLIGRAFNESWALFPPAKLDPARLGDVTHLWISHEHPDHLHFPTLRSLPAEFKSRVCVLFQRNNSKKVFDALRKIGFDRFLAMPHRRWLSIAARTRVYCAQIGQMDSSLAVQCEEETIFNLNDCEANSRDCRMLRRDIGPIDVVLNQFSIAGYRGDANREQVLPTLAHNILKTVSANHRDLGARTTIPFASLVYFCQPDNCYLNDYANTPAAVYQFLCDRDQDIVILYPGDAWRLGDSHESDRALERYKSADEDSEGRPIEKLVTVPLAQIRDSFLSRARQLRDHYPRWVLRRLQPVVCHIPDLATTVRFSLADDRFEVSEDGAATDVSINSQPLDYSFRWPWGLQTLGVSGRLVVHRNAANWRRYRILFSMNNAEIYLRLRWLLRPRNALWLVARLPGAANQLVYRLRRMRAAEQSS